MLQRIGNYEIRFEIGRGGFGRVYLGYDPRVRRLVAIKVLDKAAESSLVERFRTEANAAGNLRHENIVTIYGYGEDEEKAYLVMEYLDGRDLHQLIEKKIQLTLFEKVAIMSQIADGLRCAHKNGVIHRDVKPANVMVLGDGCVKIMDFGIARLLREGATRLTQGNNMVGTISYMAPEQFAGADVDALCDIWAFGVMSYELITGCHPFIAQDPAAIMYKITTMDPQTVLSLAEECPPDLDRIVMKLLSRDRETRYQTMEDVQFEIAPVLRDLQRSRAASLLGEAKAQLAGLRLEEANALVGKSLDLDPSNEEARKLRGTIQEAIRQQSLRPKVVAFLRQAELEAAKRNFSSALRAADSALRLAPEDLAVQNYRASLLRAWEGAEAAIQLTHQARHQLELADLTGAFDIINSALRADPASADAQRLHDQIRDRMQAREDSARLRDQLNRAEVFLAIDALHEASSFVNQLGLEHPDSIEVTELAGRLRRKKKDAELRERMRREIGVCQELLRNGDLPDAVNRLEFLSREFPNDDQPHALLAFAREELQSRERIRFCAELEQQVWRYVEKKNFEHAKAVIEHGLETYPSEPRLRELLQAIVGSRAEYEKAQHLEEGLQHCRELRDQGHLDEARAILDILRADYAAEPRLLTQREEIRARILERGRDRAIQAAAERASSLLRENQEDSAIQLLHCTIAENGEDQRLLQLLAAADLAQASAEKHREIEWRLERIAEYESAREWDAALAVIQQGVEAHGEVEDFRQARERIQTRQEIEAAVGGIESCISRKEWTTAQSLLLLAGNRHRNEPAWQELADRIKAGELQTAIERSLAARDLERAREQVAQARQSSLRIARLDAFETELRNAEFRQQSLAQAEALSAQGNYAEADGILGRLLERRPSDAEVISARKLLQERREELERWARRRAGRDEARKLADAQEFAGAIRVLKRLLKTDGPDPEVEQDLRSATAGKERVQSEAKYSRSRAEARALVSEGKLDLAVPKYQALMDQYPQDAELAREAADASGACQLELKKQAALAERDPAVRLIGEQKWRTAMAERGTRSDWPGIYQEIAEIEDLFQQRKAEQVRDRARQLLTDIEEPRVRQMLQWAEDELARPPLASVSFTMPRKEDQPAILLALIATLAAVLWAIFAPHR